MNAPWGKRVGIDPATGRQFGDHGTADDAITFVLENPGGDIEAESFLRYWDVGDLRAWPEYYSWLAARERVSLNATGGKQLITANRVINTGVAGILIAACVGSAGGDWWPLLPASLVLLVGAMMQGDPR